MNKEFDSRALTSAQYNRVQEIRRVFNDLLGTLTGDYGDDKIRAGNYPLIDGKSRELSICKTKLEEACMFAIKAVSNE